MRALFGAAARVENVKECLERRRAWRRSIALRRAICGLVRSQCPVGRGVDALVAVLPTNSVTRVRVAVDDLLDNPAARGSLGRPRLGKNAISGCKRHDRPFVDSSKAYLAPTPSAARLLGVEAVRAPRVDAGAPKCVSENRQQQLPLGVPHREVCR